MSRRGTERAISPEERRFTAEARRHGGTEFRARSTEKMSAERFEGPSTSRSGSILSRTAAMSAGRRGESGPTRRTGGLNFQGNMSEPRGSRGGRASGRCVLVHGGAGYLAEGRRV